MLFKTSFPPLSINRFPVTLGKAQADKKAAKVEKKKPVANPADSSSDDDSEEENVKVNNNKQANGKAVNGKAAPNKKEESRCEQNILPRWLETLHTYFYFSSVSLEK